MSRVLVCGGRSLPRQRPASWVVRKRADGQAVLETFSERVAAAINLTAYEVVPIGQYLGELNRPSPTLSAPQKGDER